MKCCSSLKSGMKRPLLRPALRTNRNVFRMLRILAIVVLGIYTGNEIADSDVYITHMKEPVMLIPGANRGRCCSTVNDLVDVCGRQNCISPCSSQENPVASHLLYKEKAFFHETSGASSLDIRQACAVESLARINPNLTVYVLMSGSEVDWNTKTMSNLKNLSNIHVHALNLGDYFIDTPLEHWYFCTTWNYGPYAVSHLSDALRFLTLYKFGGYYFDLDIIMIQPVILYHNFIVAEDENYLAAGAFHVDYMHPIIRMAIEEFRYTYKKNIWGHNGPMLMTRVLKKWCLSQNVTASNPQNCGGFKILPPQAFYPIEWSNWERYFSEENITWENRTIGIHVWNKQSGDMAVYKNSNQVYIQLARLKCPSTFTIAPEVF